LREIDILRARLGAEAITPGRSRSELRPDHRSESELH
jgi:hypothetical protein